MKKTVHNRIICVLLLLCGIAAAQDGLQPLTKEQRKAERERVKQEQKLLDQQAKAEKKQKLQDAAVLPTWTVIDAKPGDLKGVLIQHMRSIGYSLDSESEHMVAFSREMEGGEAVAAGIFLGGDHHRKHIEFLLTEEDGGKTRVDADAKIISKGAFGSERRTDFGQSKYFKADLQAEYDALRSWAAHQKSVAAK